MCGITGWVSEKKRGNKGLLDRMTARLAHRGPDDSDTFVKAGAYLGHRRLAVLDTSSRGRQPMNANHATVVHNGEIYNYRQLRTELEEAGQAFTSNTDTEVLLRGYLQWGINDLLTRIDGMFGFAIWDERKRQLHLARDPMGEKPLYYSLCTDGTLVFGSELTAVMTHPDVSKAIDPTSLRKYMAYDYVPAPRTILAGVQKLAPGQLITWEKGEIVDSRLYWQLPQPRHSFDNANHASDALWSSLVSSVESRLVSDVPVGLFLSGGLDSSAIAAATCEVIPASKTQTFCISFEDPSFDESSHARQVANHLGTVHHEERLTATKMVTLLPDIVSRLDEPLADPSLVPTHLLSKFVRQHVTVALGGDGGDELLMGYPTFSAHAPAVLAEKVPSAVRQHILRPMVEALPVSDTNWSLDFKLKRFIAGLHYPKFDRHFVWIGGTHPSLHSNVLEPATYAAADQNPFDDVQRILKGWRYSGNDDLAVLTMLYSRMYLAEGVLQKVDRATMAYGLESRAPLLSKEVINTVQSVNSSFKIRNRTTKWLLRKTLANRLPEAILARAKKGFGVPLTAWLKGPLNPLCRELLTNSNLRAQALFKKESLEKMIEEHCNGWKDHRKTLWSAMVFQLWAQKNGI